MKPIKTKAEIRAEIDAQIHQYLDGGGQVNKIPSGISGYAQEENIFAKSPDNHPKQSRTPLDDVVRALEARKKLKASKSSKPSNKPTRLLIKDDFGEPIRWVWRE